MQRPGSSCFATSVKMLTTGSQATVLFQTPDFVTCGGVGRERASLLTTGTRSRIEVSAKLSNRSAMVWVGVGDGTTVTRSALAVRLTPVSGARLTVCRPTRSWPEAN